MATRDVMSWETSISEVVSRDDEEEIVIRNHRLSELIGKVTFAQMLFLMLQGRLPSAAESRALDALLVAAMEHGIAPPSMISRCFASYGTTIQAAVGAGVLAFGDRMGGLGEQLARIMVERVEALETAGKPIDEAALRAAAAAVVEAARETDQRVPGYGIPLHRADPRAPQVLAVARREGVLGRFCRLATYIEEALGAARGGRPVPMNLDGVGAALILDLGFSWQSTRLFLITPRTVSMGAHYLEEQAQDTTWRHITPDRITYRP